MFEFILIIFIALVIFLLGFGSAVAIVKNNPGIVGITFASLQAKAAKLRAAADALIADVKKV